MKNPAGQIGQSHSGHRRGQHGHGVFWRRPGSMQPITSYHVISCWSMLINVGQCCLYQMCSYLSGQCGENVWGWKLHCILQICLKLGFKNLRRGTEPFPLLLSFEDQLLHLSMTCVQLIDLHCLSQPLLSLSLSLCLCQKTPVWYAKLHQTSPCHKNDDSTMAPPASFCFGIVYQGGKCGSQTSRLQIVSVLALWSNPLPTSDLKLRFAGFRSSFPSFALCSWH